jgi:hypothetical protein
MLKEKQTPKAQLLVPLSCTTVPHPAMRAAAHLILRRPLEDHVLGCKVCPARWSSTIVSKRQVVAATKGNTTTWPYPIAKAVLRLHPLGSHHQPPEGLQTSAGKSRSSTVYACTACSAFRSGLQGLAIAPLK